MVVVEKMHLHLYCSSVIPQSTTLRWWHCKSPKQGVVGIKAHSDISIHILRMLKVAQRLHHKATVFATAHAPSTGAVKEGFTIHRDLANVKLFSMTECLLRSVSAVLYLESTQVLKHTMVNTGGALTYWL